MPDLKTLSLPPTQISHTINISPHKNFFFGWTTHNLTDFQLPLPSFLLPKIYSSFLID